MRGHCGRMGARCDDELAITQSVQRGLHRALGEARFLRDHPQTHRHRPPALSRRTTKQEQVNQKRGRLLIVRDEVAHEDVEHVIVHRHGRAEARHGDSMAAIPIIGQDFSPGHRSPLDRCKAAELACRTMITHIKFVSVPVRDQNRALDFYTEKLGFTIITDQPFDEKQRWIELRIPKAETRVVLFTPEGQEDRIGSFSPLVFACANVEETYAELKARGVAFDGPPEKQPWGTFAKFRDSEGNQFVLGTPK